MPYKRTLQRVSIMHSYCQYQFSEIHISPTGVNAFPSFYPYLLTHLGEILLQGIMSLYRTAFLTCFQNRSSYRYVLPIDLNRFCPVFSTAFLPIIRSLQTMNRQIMETKLEVL